LGRRKLPLHDPGTAGDSMLAARAFASALTLLIGNPSILAACQLLSRSQT